MASNEDKKGHAFSLQSALIERDLDIEDFAVDRGEEGIEAPEIIEIVKGLVKASDNYKLRYLIPKWLRNLYFFLGHQHIDWDGRKKRWYPILLAEDNRKTINMVRSRVLSTVSALIRDQPGWEVLPRAADPQSRESARVNEKILAYLMDEAEVPSERVMMAFHQAIFGGCFARPLFDDSVGERVFQPQFEIDLATGQPIPGPDGQPIVLTDKRGKPIGQYLPPEGQVRMDLSSVFETHVPPSARLPKVSKLMWIATRKATPVDEIRRKYGLKVSPSTEAMDVSTRMSFDMGRFFDNVNPIETDSEKADAAWEYEIHCASSDDEGFEEGRKLVFVDKTLVENTKGELRGGRLPFEYFPCLPVPLRFYADAPLDDMIEPQKDYNRGRGHVAMGRSMFAFPHWVYEEGSIDRDAITSGARIIEKRTGYADPSIIDGMRLNSAVVQELKQSREDIDETGGQHSFSRGQMQGSSPQPVGTIQAMLDADMSDLQPGMEISNRAFARVGEDFLEYASKNYATERVAHVVDESDDPEVFQFTQTDIAPGLRVMVKKASQLPIMKDAMRSQMVELFKSGVLTNLMMEPGMIQWFTELFDMPSPQGFLSLTSLDVVRQERELSKLALGEQIPIGPFDDHGKHLQVIGRFTKTAQWDTLAPEAKQNVMMHAQMHQQALMAAMQAQMAMQPPGAPGPQQQPGQEPPQGLPQAAPQQGAPPQ